MVRSRIIIRKDSEEGRRKEIENLPLAVDDLEWADSGTVWPKAELLQIR